MMEIIKPDLCIIGAGAGGLDAAAGAALAGKSVVLVERESFGGSRLKAVVSSKALVTAARLARQIAGADAFGLTVSQPDVDVEKLRRYVERVTAALAPDSAPARFAGLGVRAVTGAARFVNQRRLAVGEEIEIRARHYVIATGSQPTVPDIHGLAEVPYLTEESVLALARLPAHLVVIGASAVALELAQAFRRLGAAVAVIDQGEPLAQEDPECTRVVLDALVREGVDLRTNVAIDAVARTADGVRVTLSGGLGSVGGSHLLVACGRRANVEGLALDNAGVEVGSAGVVVNRALRTTNSRIYAIGDVTGAPPFVHVARHHAGLVVHVAVLGLPARLRPEALPRVLFTDPEFAHVGLTEAEAETRRIPVRVLRWPYHENDRARIEQATRGHLKILTSRAGRVFGATIVGAAASELIAPWSLAVGWGLDIRALAGILLPYPTLGDTGHRAAMTYLTLAYRLTWVQRNLGFVTGPVSGLVSRVISGLLGR
jgi:pyruvate/2-oxoglutarate dehydrogenase complex dihydrolipoamide dehydrogenase (E3) component